MKSIFWSCLAIFLIAMTTVSGIRETSNQDRPANESVRDRLVGAWRLAWLEEQGADGRPHRVDYTGVLVYTRDGHMSVQIMARNPNAAPPTGPVQYEQGGYEAYYGKYDVDERAHTVTHHVEGALVRSLIGNDLTRVYEFSGKQLILKSSRPDEHWTVAWERY